MTMTDFETIRENKAFQRAYTRGKYYVSPVLVSYVVKNRKNALRVGITTSKKIGNAVKRNRSRRVIRAALRPFAGRLPAGYDLVFVARVKTPFAKSQELSRVMEQQLRAAGLLAGGKPEGKAHVEPR
jgi:ribonuclease P protein component